MYLAEEQGEARPPLVLRRKSASESEKEPPAIPPRRWELPDRSSSGECTLTYVKYLCTQCDTLLYIYIFTAAAHILQESVPSAIFQHNNTSYNILSYTIKIQLLSIDTASNTSCKVINYTHTHTHTHTISISLSLSLGQPQSQKLIFSLSTSLSVCLSVFLSVCLSVCLSVSINLQCLSFFVLHVCICSS